MTYTASLAMSIRNFSWKVPGSISTTAAVAVGMLRWALEAGQYHVSGGYRELIGARSVCDHNCWSPLGGNSRSSSCTSMDRSAIRIFTTRHANQNTAMHISLEEEAWHL